MKFLRNSKDGKGFLPSTNNKRCLFDGSGESGNSLFWGRAVYKCKFVHDMDPTDDIGPLRCDKD